MSLSDMSFAGGILILAVIVLRALTLNRLPKGTFLALWAVAAARLLIPFSIPSPASIYTLAERTQALAAAPAVPASTERPILTTAAFAPSAGTAAGTAAALESGTAADIWGMVWLAGAVLCGAFFLISYLRCWKKFRTALPVEDQNLLDWLAERKLRRTVSLRQSDRVDAPMTYGLLRPVILLPASWREEERMAYVLEHELVHIRRLDALWKPLLALTACVHWFNPLAWVMYVLANRDMELCCDEAVIRRFGADSRSAYALALLSMEEKRSGLEPFASAFSKNAIEERIIAIMKMKKRSIAVILTAAALVCCVGVGFATSAKDNAPYPTVQDGTFTRKELDRLASLWFEGYEDMTVAEYQRKMWAERDNPEDLELIERYGQYGVAAGVYNDREASANAFEAYFYNVYEPLTAEKWQERTFSGVATARTEDGGTAALEYDFTMSILDPDVLTVGDYERMHCYTKESMEKLLQANMSAEQFPSVYQTLSSTTPDGALEITTMCAPLNISNSTDPDAALHAQISNEIDNQWDGLLSPYAPFGLTWEFNDPDLDGNGLTMWFEGKEVRGIYDEQEGIWITEHTGNSAYSDGAVELYTVYTDGKLSGLRLATPEEQAAFDADRQKSQDLGPATIRWGTLKYPGVPEPEEQREFPRATQEEYDALLTLRTAGYGALSLEDFNQRLLDWANENNDAWDRINCDVIWNDCGVELTPEEQAFVSLTCRLSGTENGQMVRALYTGGPETDPGFAVNLPEKYQEEAGIRTAWCNLYYDVSYHISDKSAATVDERDACAAGMMDAIDAFWRDTDLDTLLTMTKEDVVAKFNVWAGENSTENVRFNPVTGDNIHFEINAEWGLD